MLQTCFNVLSAWSTLRVVYCPVCSPTFTAPMSRRIWEILFIMAKTFGLCDVVKEKRLDKGQKINASPKINNPPLKLTVQTTLKTPNKQSKQLPTTKPIIQTTQTKIKEKKLEYTNTNEVVVRVLLVKRDDFRAPQSMLAKTWSLWKQCIEYLTESVLSYHYFVNN